MSDSLDGLSNDVTLVPALLEQLRQIIPGPMLSIWDHQFGAAGAGRPRQGGGPMSRQASQRDIVGLLLE